MNRRDLIRMGLLAASTPLLSLPLQGCDKDTVGAMSTRRLSLTDFSPNPPPQAEGNATSATSTAAAENPTSEVALDVYCDTGKWSITETNGIFITKKGKHDGREKFISDDSRPILTISGLTCPLPPVGKKFDVGIQEENPHHYKSCKAEVIDKKK